jgi:hypothetical protein
MTLSVCHSYQSEVWFPYNDDGLALVGLSGLLVGGSSNDLAHADRYSMLVNPSLRLRMVENLTGTVDLAHHEPSEDRLVEGGIGSA